MTGLSSHLDSILDPKRSKLIVKNLSYLIKNSKIDFDYIAVSGYSGSLIAVPISIDFNKRIVVVRKENESRNSAYDVEMTVIDACESYKYIIVDDLIFSGKTINHIVNTISLETRDKHKCVGIFIQEHPRMKTFITTNDDKIPVFNLGED